VNQAWVKRYAGGRDPVGLRVRFTFSPNEPLREVVGVIGNLTEDNLASPPPATLYLPIDQNSGYAGYLSYVVRTNQEPSAFFSTARSVLRGLDPQLAVIQAQSMDELLNSSPAVFLRRYPFLLIGAFATLAVVLAMVGLYGLVSYSVLQRRREIGIRMALGAQREDILRLILRQGIIAAVAGVGIGLVLALGLTRVMASLLYGTGSSAWFMFAGVALLLAAIALTASYIPARRAAKVDPMVALRND
jgi:putative ABC transport system permease protein